jgi:predicted MFS family arabinose efflux permease
LNALAHEHALSPKASVQLFLVFAFAYFLATLLRAVTATLAPVFSQELALSAADLGLLAGAYFLGFSMMQLPLGKALDSQGPRRVLLALISLAVVGCACFALARSMTGLFFARVLIGMGVGACLMAPLTAYRRRFTPAAQLRANSWMLMTGSLGMLASTLPVQALLPHLGWRGLFWAVAAALMLAVALIFVAAPPDQPAQVAQEQGPSGGYREIASQPIFMRLAPMGFFIYGGLIAVQALWAGPWLTQVAGRSAGESAAGLFIINLSMLVAFFSWGLVMPRLVRRGIDTETVMRWGVPLTFALLALNLTLGPAAGPWHWAAWCVNCTFVSLSQPAVGQAFPAAQAGRALSAYNLVIFSGVFAVQWGIGLGVDALRGAGASVLQAYRVSFGVFGLFGVASYLWFVWPRGTQRP